MFASDDASVAHESWALISLYQGRATMWYVRGRNESLETYIKLIPKLSDLEPVEREVAKRIVDSVLSFDEACGLGTLICEIQPDRDLHIVPHEGYRELLACLQRGRSYEILKTEDGVVRNGIVREDGFHRARHEGLEGVGLFVIQPVIESGRAPAGTGRRAATAPSAAVAG